MKLSKSLTKVTLFSKLLTSVLFILLPFIGFYLGMQFQISITPQYPPLVYEPPLEHPVKVEPTGLSNNLNRQPVCDQDAKKCPNGSYVGRTGPNCEFVCPK
jgi:hypothetical protein